MRLPFKIGLAIVLVCSWEAVFSQDLAPRAYITTPLHSNAVTLTYSFSDGSVLLNDAVPITDSSGRLNVEVFSYFHSFGFLGRSANVTTSLPYGIGTFEGSAATSHVETHRSGLAGASVRFSVNLHGAPAMDLPEFFKWRQKTIIGLSLKVVLPSGQYDPTRLVNLGTNRWAFKPEIGWSRRWNRWVVDAYSGAWFFTTNPDYFSRNEFSPGTNKQSEKPIGAFEGHLSYDVKTGLWASLDANFWYGGTSSINGVENPQTLQKNSRVGGTVSVPIRKHQTLKFSYSNGAYVNFGGNFQNVSMAWQYSWLGRPR